MRFLTIIFRSLRLGLLCLLLIYWAGFIGYTAAKLTEGGPSKAATWYKHIAYMHTDITKALPSMNWRVFWAVQFIYLAITLLLCFSEWRLSRNRSQDAREAEDGRIV